MSVCPRDSRLNHRRCFSKFWVKTVRTPALARLDLQKRPKVRIITTIHILIKFERLKSLKLSVGQMSIDDARTEDQKLPKMAFFQRRAALWTKAAHSSQHRLVAGDRPSPSGLRVHRVVSAYLESFVSSSRFYEMHCALQVLVWWIITGDRYFLSATKVLRNSEV